MDSSLRMTRASGHMAVLEMSATRKAEASSLLPVPMEQMMGVSAALARSTSASLPVTVSMASTI